MLPNRQAKTDPRPWREGVLLAATLLLLAGCHPSPSPAPTQTRVDFNFHVRPILSDRCFTCHGPDEKSRKADLRLDLAEAATRPRKNSPPAITPGKLSASALWDRITSSDPSQRMPPPKSKLSLTAAEIATLRRWIEQGAEYQPHWAFTPVRKPNLPEANNLTHSTHPIDRFIRSRLRQEGLEPSSRAAPDTLLRRASLDLRGLPPTLAEMDAFYSAGPQAYEKAIDQFLASPAYGEHQAALWLDLARYADTYGYQSDVDVDLSPWRDWVIQAFDQNLPYDQFLTWQLAGDLLPNANTEQVLATAFNRLHRQTNEGGSIEEEFRTEYAADRVQTFGTAMLGLTLGCARCHDHKYDPVSQKDFYSLLAFFNNIDESGLYSHFTMATPTPAMPLYRDGEAARHRQLQSKVATQEERFLLEVPVASNRFSAWLHQGGLVEKPQPLAAYDFSIVTNARVLNLVSTNYPIVLVDTPQVAPGRTGHALRFSGDNSAVAKSLSFNRVTPFSLALALQPGEAQDRAVVLHFSRAWTDSGSRGFELLLERGRPGFSLIHFWPGNALKILALDPLPLHQWSHLTVTYDGSSRAEGVRLYLNGRLMRTQTVRDRLTRDITHRREWGDADTGGIELTLAGRFRDSGFKNGLIDDLQVFDRALTSLEVSTVAGLSDPKPPSDVDGLREYYFARVDAGLQTIASALHQARKDENEFITGVREIMVMQELPMRRTTHVLQRGAYDAPGEEVRPGTPNAVLPFSGDWPANRLGLARWTVATNNPLTARVAVNRVWRQHFGRGLVATEEDFGIQGSLPTHPELLDWLAWEFMQSGWDLKALHKLILTSETYQQTSEASPTLIAKDPQNLWLARGPKNRLRAEEIRDGALAASGLLVSTIGGPSVKPHQPEGLWEQSGIAKHYVPSQGDSLYRRSLYTFWRRTAPPPNMVVFDAPTREVCTARRESTTTPLQALVLLNDPQFIEASRALAERVISETTTALPDRIQRATRLALGRPARPLELELLQQLHREQRAYFEANSAAATTYLKTGARPPSPSIPPAELAAMTVVANAIFNLDEFVMKR
jgi:hypothetical protein